MKKLSPERLAEIRSFASHYKMSFEKGKDRLSVAELVDHIDALTAERDALAGVADAAQFLLTNTIACKERNGLIEALRAAGRL